MSLSSRAFPFDAPFEVRTVAVSSTGTEPLLNAGRRRPWPRIGWSLHPRQVRSAATPPSIASGASATAAGPGARATCCARRPSTSPDPRASGPRDVIPRRVDVIDAEREKSRTWAPLFCSRVTIRIRSSSTRAWRTTWRFTPKRRMSGSSTRRSRGASRPKMMSSSSARTTSASVGPPVSPGPLAAPLLGAVMGSRLYGKLG